MSGDLHCLPHGPKLWHSVNCEWWLALPLQSPVRAIYSGGESFYPCWLCKKNVSLMTDNCICKLYLTGVSPFDSPLCLMISESIRNYSPRAWFGSDTFDFCFLLHLLFDCSPWACPWFSAKKCGEPQHCSGLVSKTAGISSPPNAPLCPRRAVLCWLPRQRGRRPNSEACAGNSGSLDDISMKHPVSFCSHG